MNRTQERVLENRLRRVVARRGLMLRKSRRRDPDAYDYGKWYICALPTGDLVAELGSTEEVEAWLKDHKGETWS